MRKITQQACNAFEKLQEFDQSNTRVSVSDGVATLILFGNVIAKNDHGQISICDGGRQSATTKERLNGLSGVMIQQVNFQRFLNGEKWNGERTKI